MKLTEFVPLGMITVLGTLTTTLLLESETTTPDGPPGPVKVTDPVVDAPPRTLFGLTPTDDKVGRLTVKNPVVPAPPNVPVTPAEIWESTLFVDTGNVADFWLDGMVTDGGAVTKAELLESETTVPLDPDGPESVTVPWLGFPPMTAPGLKLMLATMAGVTVKVAVAVLPFNEPVIVVIVDALTPLVFTTNVALV